MLSYTRAVPSTMPHSGASSCFLLFGPTDRNVGVSNLEIRVVRFVGHDKGSIQQGGRFLQEVLFVVALRHVAGTYRYRCCNALPVVFKTTYMHAIILCCSLVQQRNCIEADLCLYDFSNWEEPQV